MSRFVAHAAINKLSNKISRIPADRRVPFVIHFRKAVF